jgi:hypothetical protein
MKYRHKPLVLEAVQFTGNNIDEIVQFVKETHALGVVWLNSKNTYSAIRNNEFTSPGISLKTREGECVAVAGDYIIKDENNEYYVYSQDVFEKAFEAVN